MEIRRSRRSWSLSDTQSVASIVRRLSPAKALSRFRRKAGRANGQKVLRQANRRSYSREMRVRTDEYSISVLARSTQSNGNGLALVARPRALFFEPIDAWEVFLATGDFGMMTFSI